MMYLSKVVRVQTIHLQSVQHTFIDTFEDQLVGANVGDEVEVKVTFPEDYQAEALKGKEAFIQGYC